VALSPEGAADAVRYHLDRPVQIESSPALVVLGLDALGLGDATSVSSHRSDGLLHPAADAVTWLFAAAFVALVAFLGAAAASAPAGGDGARRALVLASLAATAGFAVLGKVLSPQFVIWVLPLGALAFAWRLYALAGAVAMVAVLTQIEFPAHYFDVVAREPWAIAVVAARNLVLLTAIVLAVRAIRGPRANRATKDRRAVGPPYSSAGISSCFTDVARPPASASISTAFSQGSSSEVSKRTFVSITKRSSACSRFTPITPPRGPVIPTSVT
jgi:hypothetical protein